MSQVWSDLRDSATKAMAARDYHTALLDWQSALAESDTFAEGDGRRVTSLEGLAQAHLAKGDLGEAESLYKRALALRQEKQGGEHIDLAAAHNNLGVVYFKKGAYKEALSSFEKALVMRRKTLGNDHLDVGKVLYHLAMACHAEKRYDEADGHYRKALDIKNKQLGNNHPDLINLLRNYADLLRQTSRDGIAGQMEQFAQGIEGRLKST